VGEKATQLLWDTWGNVYNTEKMWLLKQTDLFFVFVEQSIPSIPQHDKSSLIMSVQSIVTFIMGSADISEGKMREISWIMRNIGEDLILRPNILTAVGFILFHGGTTLELRDSG
jgi:hypothetical protein